MGPASSNPSSKWFDIAKEIRNSSETNYGLHSEEHEALLHAMEGIMLEPKPGLQVSMLEVFCRLFKDTGYLQNTWRYLEDLIPKLQGISPAAKWSIVIQYWRKDARAKINPTVENNIATLEKEYAEMEIERWEVQGGSQMRDTTTVAPSATSANQTTFTGDTLTVSSSAGAQTHHVSSALMKVHCRFRSCLLTNFALSPQSQMAPTGDGSHQQVPSEVYSGTGNPNARDPTVSSVDNSLQSSHDTTMEDAP
jgi:hypothetical protein